MQENVLTKILYKNKKYFKYYKFQKKLILIYLILLLN